MLWKRSISILRPSPTTVIPSNVLSSSQLDLKPLFENESDQTVTENGAITSTTRFQLLGDNPTLASIQVSPSIPLYVRHRSLVSIHDADRLSNVSVSFKKWFKLWPTLSLSRFDKVVGTNQFNCLVSSVRPSDTLSLLQLNGTYDWIVLNPNSILSFEENSSLSIQWFHKYLNYFGWLSNKISVFSNYGKLSGRGNVLLNGSGSIYKLELKSEEDQILLQKNRILAINGLNKLDFSQAVTLEKSSALKHTDSKQLENSTRNDTNADNTTANAFLQFLQKLASFIKTTWQSYNSSDFVRVKGPRTVLVQTDPKSANHISWADHAMSLKPAKNYLSFASVTKDSTIKFRNTSSLLNKK